jgi:Polyketide cyclase / dehydrase and lipid transport
MDLPMWWARRAVDAPAPVVWRLLVDLDAWPRWGPTVSAARLDDGRRVLSPGATGAVRTPVGVWLPFTVTELTEPPSPTEPTELTAPNAEGATAGWSWSWRVVGVPATRHDVRATGERSSAVAFGAPVWAPAYLPVLAVSLDRLARLAQADTP